MARSKMNLPLAITLALLLHLLLLLGSEMFPGLGAAWSPEVSPRSTESEPLRFTFVDLAEERPEPERVPEDATASDRTRQAISERASELLPPSPDPFSQGNTDQRIDAQPALDPSPDRKQPQAVEAESSPARKTAPRQKVPVAAEPMFPAPQEEPEDNDSPSSEPQDDTEAKMDALQRALRPFNTRDIGQRYDNQAPPALTDFGPISFDTVGVDWGPYARKIVEIIRARWFERMPQAARLGIAGRSILSFRIALDGGVSGIVLKDSSGYRPLDKAAEFAIEASELPPLPPSFLALDEDRESVGVTFEFYYNMRVPKR